MISEFRGQYRWLSNFWPAVVALSNDEYPSVEHAYQASKYSPGHYMRDHIKTVTAAQAKSFGKQAPRTTHYHNNQLMRITIMRSLVYQKFLLHETLRNMLIATGDEHIQEGNWWGDTFWGVCNGVGENNLGKLIMEIRKEILDAKLP